MEFEQDASSLRHSKLERHLMLFADSIDKEESDFNTFHDVDESEFDKNVIESIDNLDGSNKRIKLDKAKKELNKFKSKFRKYYDEGYLP